MLYFSVAEGEVPGLKEEDLEASVATLQSMAETLDAECVALRHKEAQEGKVAEYLIRKRADEKDFMEVRWVWGYRLSRCLWVWEFYGN